jgi:hypothetical protein
MRTFISSWCEGSGGSPENHKVATTRTGYANSQELEETRRRAGWFADERGGDQLEEILTDRQLNNFGVLPALPSRQRTIERKYPTTRILRRLSEKLGRCQLELFHDNIYSDTLANEQPSYWIIIFLYIETDTLDITYTSPYPEETPATRHRCSFFLSVARFPFPSVSSSSLSSFFFYTLRVHRSFEAGELSTSKIRVTPFH